jgi:serine/threonine protein kinase
MGEPLTAVEAADLLIAASVRCHGRSLLIQPGPNGHEASMDTSTGRKSAILPRALGDAVVVRLGLLAGIDPWSREKRLGGLRVQLDGTSAEFLLAIHRTPGGFGAELRPLLQASDSSPTVGLPSGKGAPKQIGSYQILARLGQGGMGTVFRAEEEGRGRQVAVKLLHTDKALDPEIAARFVREGQAASLANHPGIVSVLDFGALPDGRAFLVMELVADETLAQALEAGPFELSRALTVTRRILAALEAAHVRGVLHLDLKPSNVFLGTLDEVKIADFGAAQVIDAQADRATPVLIVGTPAYMSPEQARGDLTDERSDLYAMGCLFFRMVSGETPCLGQTLIDVVLSHAHDPVPPLRSHYGPVPPEVQALSNRALAKHPDDRYSSAGAMSAEIDRILAGRRTHEPAP